LELVQLEITESAAPQGSEALRRLQKLKQLGVLIALDDFGTGFSSLSSLHLFNADVIKIDQSFVADLNTNAYKKALVESMVKVAQSLNLSTVAEGVETLEQKILLHVLGCDIGQGYLFSKPLPLAELVQGFEQARRTVA
jgi:EAL domain-containing protein (putative c-di-GMP-specific phosphodiesterase class I)